MCFLSYSIAEDSNIQTLDRRFILSEVGSKTPSQGFAAQMTEKDWTPPRRRLGESMMDPPITQSSGFGGQFGLRLALSAFASLFNNCAGSVHHQRVKSSRVFRASFTA